MISKSQIYYKLQCFLPFSVVYVFPDVIVVAVKTTVKIAVKYADKKVI